MKAVNLNYDDFHELRVIEQAFILNYCVGCLCNFTWFNIYHNLTNVHELLVFSLIFMICRIYWQSDGHYWYNWMKRLNFIVDWEIIKLRQWLITMYMCVNFVRLCTSLFKSRASNANLFYIWVSLIGWPNCIGSLSWFTESITLYIVGLYKGNWMDYDDETMTGLKNLGLIY